MKTTVMILCMTILFSCAQSTNNKLFEKKVITALKHQMTSYPKSTIRDTLSVLLPYLDSTGWEHRFVRVDLRVIKEGKVKYRDFFEAFVRSSQAAPVVSVEEWTKEWTRIVTVLEKQSFSVIHQPDYQADKDSIDAMLQRGEYIGHHSREYVASYAPHYRLIAVEELHSLGL
jgi:hypothetical protein